MRASTCARQLFASFGVFPRHLRMCVAEIGLAAADDDSRDHDGAGREGGRGTARKDTGACTRAHHGASRAPAAAWGSGRIAHVTICTVTVRHFFRATACSSRRSTMCVCVCWCGLDTGGTYAHGVLRVAFQDAMKHYIRALTLAPKTPVAASCHTNLGTCFYQLVRPEGSLLVVPPNGASRYGSTVCRTIWSKP